MPSKRYGWNTIQIRDQYKSALQAVYDFKEKDLLDEDIRTFNAFVNEKILKGIALQELTARFKVEGYDHEITVLDRYLKKSFRVALKEDHLVCLTDEVPEDVHTFFVRYDKKVRQALEARGINPNEV